MHVKKNTINSVLAGADPELLLGGGANPLRGRLSNILVIFSKKPYEIKEILVPGGGAPSVLPLNPPLTCMFFQHLTNKLYLLTLHVQMS